MHKCSDCKYIVPYRGFFKCFMFGENTDKDSCCSIYESKYNQQEEKDTTNADSSIYKCSNCKYSNNIFVDEELLYCDLHNTPTDIDSICTDWMGYAVDEAIYNKFNKDDNYISWDQYFMSIAQIVAKRSKDPNTKVGACIVRNNRIISTGYNGFPHGLSDNKYPWTKGNSDITKNKYFYVVHAELNAILNAPNNVIDSTLYVTLFPCNECAKAIIQSGIKKVIYLDSHSGIDTEEKQLKFKATEEMFKDAGIEYKQYKKTGKSITIDI